ncbi:MAG: iron-sulfur cluster biosynthesis protein [Vagococcus sp.]|uniref:HesB/YadR/YfhF family protein n=1 Tax=Vagococcus sp. TaxID=1933889 RepID=UPI002FC6A2F9
MELEITPEAIDWFKKELLLSEGASVRIYGKYGGATNVHVGFSTGIEVTSANQPMLEKRIDGITFFTEEGDEWFFADYKLEIAMDEQINEPKYTYL